MTNVEDCWLSWAVCRKGRGKVINHRDDKVSWGKQVLAWQTRTQTLMDYFHYARSCDQICFFIKRNFVFSPCRLYRIWVLMMWTQANCISALVSLPHQILEPWPLFCFLVWPVSPVFTESVFLFAWKVIWSFRRYQTICPTIECAYCTSERRADE